MDESPHASHRQRDTYPLITPVVVCLSPWRHDYLCDAYPMLISSML
jgi:hypothetical protein